MALQSTVVSDLYAYVDGDPVGYVDPFGDAKKKYKTPREPEQA